MASGSLKRLKGCDSSPWISMIRRDVALERFPLCMLKALAVIPIEAEAIMRVGRDGDCRGVMGDGGRSENK